MGSIRTLLVDDSPQFLEAALRFLEMDPLIEIIGSTHTGQDAIHQVNTLEPDLVVMDLALPGMNGLEATRRIKAQPEPPQIIILTLHDNAEYRKAGEAAKADGFVAKSDFAAQLLPLIHTLFKQRQKKIEEASGKID